MTMTIAQYKKIRKELQADRERARLSDDRTEYRTCNIALFKLKECYEAEQAMN